MSHTDAPLMLSVSGARGVVGTSMTPALASEYAAAFGSMIRAGSTESAPLLCIGRDSRPSGEMLAMAVRAGLRSVGCRVVDLGVVATPTVGVMIDRHRAAGGMVITASHNPIEWNGIKSLNADGVAPPLPQCEELLRRFRERDFSYASVEQLGDETSDSTGDEVHVERVLAIVDGDAIRQAGITVVLDSINGAGCRSGRMLLERLGCRVVHLNGEPHGRFAHTPEPTRENLTDLAERVPRERAAIGFAQDPDADRLAMVDEHGRYIGEEYTLVMAAKRALDLHAAGIAPFASRQPVLATNLSTSRMIDLVAAGYPGARVLRTAVGEANVVEALKPADGLIGGEGNGGVIVPAICWVRDSLSSMALVLDMLAHTGATLSELVDAIPALSMVKRKFDLSAIGGRDALGPMFERLRGDYAHAVVNDADGLRIDLPQGWVHLRPSNTEPIVRLIAEAESEPAVRALIDDVARITGLE